MILSIIFDIMTVQGVRELKKGATRARIGAPVSVFLLSAASEVASTTKVSASPSYRRNSTWRPS